MKKLACFALAATAVLGIAGTASAQGIYLGVGPGYNDYGPRPYYQERYVEPRAYRRPPPRYYTQQRYRTRNGCPPNYTVQDGVCKPYRGY